MRFLKKFKATKLKLNKVRIVWLFFFLLIGVSFIFSLQEKSIILQQNSKKELETQKQKTQDLKKQLDELMNEDQYKINQELKEEIENIKKSFQKAVLAYESLLDVRIQGGETKEFDILFAKSLSYLSERDYQSAQETIDSLNQNLSDELEKLAPSPTLPIVQKQEDKNTNVNTNNSPPDTGYSRQYVNTSLGNFLVSIVSSDISTTKVIVDTASQTDCRDKCPVLSLGEYISRNNAFAGINGTYFCPATYPSCADKKNSFDLLVMNKDKVYFNSDNNVYSNNPGAIFGSGYVRFVSSISQWGRDTSPDGVLSNYPLLVFNGQNYFAGDDDPKKGTKAGRSFVASKGSKVFIGVVHYATVTESAHVLHSLGMENALNLDSGGSTALWSGGYKVGPGRNIPNAVLFVPR